MNKRTTVLVAAILLLLSGGSLRADLMPDFATVPVGWFTDRYQPNSFSNVGTYQGVPNVLGIGISAAQGYTSRPAGYQSTFYDTQGMQYTLNSTGSEAIAAALYVPGAWSDPNNGSRRTDMWGVMQDSTHAVSDYPIIGFTNYGGPARFRYWDENQDNNNGAWVDVTAPVLYDQWNDLSIAFTGSEYDYYVNGVEVATDTTVNSSIGFGGLIMQAYNFNGDPSIAGAITDGGKGDYTAYWANTPEPFSVGLLGTAMAVIGFAARRRSKVRS